MTAIVRKKIKSGKNSLSYDYVQTLKKEAVWKNLRNISVRLAVAEWLSTLTLKTSKNYASGINRLSELQLININVSLQQFALINHDAIIDKIKALPDVAECTRQARAACYISFTRFLSRRTQGVIPKATPSKEGSVKTFYKVREKVATQAMNRAEWTEFLEELEKLNKRDALIAKIILQGGKRMSEVLALTTDKIHYAAREITFIQSKTKGYHKETVITYPAPIIEQLKDYIGDRTGIVFVTRHKKGVMPNQLAVTFIAVPIPFLTDFLYQYIIEWYRFTIYFSN